MGPSHTHTCTHTHKSPIYLHETHSAPEQNVKYFAYRSLWTPCWEIFSVCGPTAKVPLCIWNRGQFLYGNPLKARPIDGHKIPQMTNSESVRCPCSRSERLIALLGLQRDGGEKNTRKRKRRRRVSSFIFFSSATRQSEWWKDHFLVIKGEVCDLTLQAVECGLMIGLQLFWAPWNTNVTVMCFHSRESLNPGVQGCISEKWTACPTALCCCLAAIDK